MPRLRLAVASAMCGTAATLAACSLFTDLGSLDEPPPAGDAAQPGSDASSAETSTPGDTGTVDAPSAVDAGGCGVDFCESFDDASVAGEGWTSQTAVGGTLGLDTTNVVSPPKALRAELAANASFEYRTALLRKDLPAGGKVTCTFSVLLSGGFSDANREIDLVRIEAEDPTYPVHRFNLALRGPHADFNAFNGSVRDDLFYGDGGCACPATHQYFPGPGVGKWVRTVFVVDYANGTTSVSFDDAVAFSGGSFTKLAPTRTAVYLGLGSRTGTAPVALFDDLRCDVE